ncbi:enoyl-CoA hydratase-related protein [Microbacterium sp. zg-Y818]|uniref:enoyl-CoA hydratase/isomerase family protein n=1 Tax=unclassified Microbacterium TaxID=2609290 RepID=UPI00214AF8F5|nr:MULTISPECIES: enoyl-CoA hydratase-related protein [unclassified Microbacterium]MCR2799345.1 enoyl-CoA hydratase-related protein [Microbacterium sp. zg.Y818]WIM21345.1 enoyl-CoA hydratase-related protein [Microbacterium sp. zg-Y818]
MTTLRVTSDAEPELLVEDTGAVRVLTLNRPRSLNAISRSLGHALIEQFLAADDDPNVRVVILTGAGDRAFSAGGDLKERVSAEETPAERERFAHDLLERRRSTLSIAAVNGLAYGGGLELVLSCDFAIATPDARFALPEATRGILASGGGIVRLPQVIGRQRALRLAATGESVDADTALAWGIVSEVVPADRLRTAALALADRLTAGSPLAVDATRRIMLALEQDQEAWALNAQLRRIVGASSDAQEGPRAFAEKRPPRWTGH